MSHLLSQITYFIGKKKAISDFLFALQPNLLNIRLRLLKMLKFRKPMLVWMVLLLKKRLTSFLVLVRNYLSFFFSFFFIFFYHLGAEVFAQKITDPRGPYAELEVLAKTNPILYEKRLSSLRDAFSIFRGEVSLYYRYITG